MAGTGRFDFEAAERSDAGREAGAAVLSVRELCARIDRSLKGIGRVAVQGELSGLKRPASGHLYFDLKDSTPGMESLVHCVVWRSQVARALATQPTEGAEVVVHGSLDVYPPRGTYTLIVERIEQRGLGALLVQLEELKKRLAAQGWFDRKRALPRFPRVVGVVTSRDGAALRDFLKTRSQRWPGYPVRLAHSAVQGPGAAREIAAALARLERSGVDLIVLCRGGGSLEDLWAFNELPVAEAIWAAGVPVVSGVGHESDTTLADLVADLRAHTPTDAARLAIPDRAELTARMGRLLGYLGTAIDRHLERREERLARLAATPALRDPRRQLELRQERLRAAVARLHLAGAARLERRERRLETLSARLRAQSPGARLERSHERLAALALRLGRPLEDLLVAGARRLELSERSLEATSPFRVLERGYSITVRAASGEPLLDAASVTEGERTLTYLARGTLESRVEAVRARRDGGPADGP